MPRKPTEFSQILEAARLFYEENLNKTNIASRLSISATQVKRLLDAAREREIVKVVWSPPRSEVIRKELLSRFKVLRDTVVIPSSEDFAFERELCAKAGADYFETIIKPGMSVAIGGGNTVSDFIGALEHKTRDIHLFSTALVGRGPILDRPDRLFLVTQLWQKCGSQPGRAHYVTIPPFEKSKKLLAAKKLLATLYAESQRFLAERSKVRGVFEGMKRVDIAVVSLGPVNIGREYREEVSPGTSLVEILAELGITETVLLNEGIVGEVGYSFFDREGRTRPEWECFISLGVNHYRQMVAEKKTVLMMADSKHKREAIKAALKGQLFNVLVTDEATAEDLLASP